MSLIVFTRVIESREREGGRESERKREGERERARKYKADDGSEV